MIRDANAPRGKINLKRFISREFFKAALLPLLIIVVTLLAMYFFMNAYILENAVKTLREDRYSHLMGITESQAHNIDEQLSAVSNLASVLQSTTSRFFKHPDSFLIATDRSLFRFAPNGVYYKTKNDGGSSLFYSNRTPVKQSQKQKALATEALDPFYKEIYEANSNTVAVYLNTFDSMSRYYPYVENVHEQLPPDMDIPTYNFYYLADKEHNPNAQTVWTEAYLDPMGQGWMMSCLVPIYHNDFLEGVSGIDITIKNYINNLLSLTLPWDSSGLLVDSKGTIMAMPPSLEKILDIEELDEYKYQGKVEQDTLKPQSFNLITSVLSKLRQPLSGLMQQQSGLITLSLGEKNYVLSQHTVLATGWKFIVIADEEMILQPITSLDRRTQFIGYTAVCFMCLFYIFFFLYLLVNTRKMSGRIAQPISMLAHATQNLATGNYQTKIEKSDVIELDQLSTGFQAMSMDLKKLHDNLKDQTNFLEQTVTERTREMAAVNRKLEEDIKKRKQMQEVLDAERRQLLSIFDSIDEVIYISTPDTYELLYVNEAFRKFWPDVIGKKCYQVLQGRDEPCTFCTNPIIFGEKTGQAHIWEHQNLDTGRWYRCIDKAIQWPDGRMVRYEMAINITEQKIAAQEKEQLEISLRRAEKMEALGALAGGVAHDLNNILGGIVGYPELILLKMSPDDPLRKSVETIRSTGLRASAIVQDLLALARRGVSVMEPVNLNKVVKQFLDSPEYIQITSDIPDVEIEVSLHDQLLNNMGSSVHLTKMLMNLVSNGYEAMPDGGKLFVSTENKQVEQPIKGYDEVQKGEYAHLRIADTGLGIEPQDLEKIFEPFYTNKKMGRSGTGLGMAVVWGTVTDHKGYIEINSTINKGTTIDIYLPTTSNVINETQQEFDISNYKGNSETILIVDDNPLQREVAIDLLEQLGYVPHAVSSGEAAIVYLEQHQVDVLLLDMIMDPGIDGLQTFKEVIELHPEQKSIIVSGFSETAAVAEAQQLGAGNYLKKPYTIKQLGEELKRILQ